MTMRTLHGLSAMLILGFALVHLTNHLVGLLGVEAHIAFMRSARMVYRFPLVEVPLLAAVAFQSYSGITLVVRGWGRRQGFIAWLQAVSGAYLAFFFLIHIGAVLFGRVVLQLDTTFYFAAAGFHVPPFQFFFAPYYFLGVLALFTHVGCALCRRIQSESRAARALVMAAASGLGLVVSLLIVLSLAGVFYRVEVPAEYKATYGGS